MRRRVFLMGMGAAAGRAAAQPAGLVYQPLFDGTTLQGWTVHYGPSTAFYASGGEIIIHPSSGFPAWLGTNEDFENFDFRGEVFLKGWANGGIYLCAPRYGRPTECGFKINLFHKPDVRDADQAMGSIFPLVAPTKVNVRPNEWNSFRIRLDWPQLTVWINGERVQDVNCDHHPELRFRRRSGALGIESLSYPLRFRALEVARLPGRLAWDHLYFQPADLGQWEVLERGRFEALGDVLRADGLGYLATRNIYQDFEWQCYVRAAKHSNGGILFRAQQPADGYEIQLHDVEGAVYPTGSLYHYARCRPYPRIAPEEWFPLQIVVQGRRCVVRVNGDTVVDYSGLEKTAPGRLMIQAHQEGKWIEYREIRVRRLPAS